MQSSKIAVSMKHFACNNKEANRFNCDSRLSERALREIYLRPFEIAVKTAKPYTIMSCYNRVNGEYVGESKKLLNDISVVNGNIRVLLKVTGLPLTTELRLSKQA